MSSSSSSYFNSESQSIMELSISSSSGGSDTHASKGLTLDPYYSNIISSTATSRDDDIMMMTEEPKNFSVLGNRANGTFIEEVYDQIEFSLTFQVCIYILYNVVFVSAVLGNLLVIYVVGSSVRMRTVTNYLIGNLALGDLLMALLCVPFSYISVLLQYWPFGQLLCHIVSPAQAVCVFVSAYTLVALAIDRYMAILYPLRPRLRRSQALIVIAVVWVVALLTAAPIALFTRLTIDEESGLPRCEESGWADEQMKLAYSLTLMVLQYFFPITVLIFTYTRIALAVWGKKAPGEAEDARDQRLAKAKRKMIKMMLTVVIVYTISWLPFNSLLVAGDIWPEKIYVEHGELVGPFYLIIHWLAVSHTVCNPIIYCWMNSRFRQGFRSAVGNVPCFNRLLLLPCFARGDSPTNELGSQRGYYLGYPGATAGNTTTNFGGTCRGGFRLVRTNTSCTTYTFSNGGPRGSAASAGGNCNDCGGATTTSQHNNPNYYHQHYNRNNHHNLPVGGVLHGSGGGGGCGDGSGFSGNEFLGNKSTQLHGHGPNSNSKYSYSSSNNVKYCKCNRHNNHNKRNSCSGSSESDLRGSSCQSQRYVHFNTGHNCSTNSISHSHSSGGSSTSRKHRYESESFM